MQRHKFLRDVATLLTGAISAQALAFLLIPIITRLYSVENFGIMTTFSTIVTTITVISCGCYEQAIILPKETTKAWNIFALSMLFCICISFLCLIAVIFFHIPLSGLLFQSPTAVWLWFAPLAVFLGGTRLNLNYWTIRGKQFVTLSFSRLFSVLGNQGIKIVSGLAIGDRAGGLIAGIVGYSLFPNIILFLNIRKKYPNTIKLIPKKNDLRLALKEYRNFPLFSTWNELLVNIGRSLPIFFLAYLFDNKVVGAFGLANNVLRVPIGLIANSFRQVYLQKAAYMAADGKPLSSLMLKNTLGLLAASIIPFGIMIMFGPKLFALLFGNEWIVAGKFAQILAPWLLTMFILPPSTVIYTILQKQRIRLIFYVIITAAQVVCFLFAKQFEMEAVKLLMLIAGVCSTINIIQIANGYRIAMSTQ